MSNKNNKPVVKINGWFKQRYGTHSETSEPRYVIIGRSIEGHPRLGNARDVRTSIVVETDDKTYAETLNTYYVLGEPA